MTGQGVYTGLFTNAQNDPTDSPHPGWPLDGSVRAHGPMRSIYLALILCHPKPRAVLSNKPLHHSGASVATTAED